MNPEAYVALQRIAKKLIENQNDFNTVDDLHSLRTVLQAFERPVPQIIVKISTAGLYKFIIPEKKDIIKDNVMLEVVNCLSRLLEISITEKITLFFNIYNFLIDQIYEMNNGTVANICEERKLAVVSSLTNLIHSLSHDLIPDVYKKENIFKLCPLLNVLLLIARNEKLRVLRIEAMMCLQAYCQIDSADKFHDTEILELVANLFAPTLPGLICGLRDIALGDEKAGHKIIMTAFQTLSKLMIIMMRDYKDSDQNENPLSLYVKSSDTIRFSDLAQESESKPETNSDTAKNPSEIKRDKLWFKNVDLKLQGIIINLKKLTKYQHPKVRLALAESYSILVKYCANTMPLSMLYIVETIITLSQDDELDIAKRCQAILNKLFAQFESANLFKLSTRLEEMFFTHVNSLARIFNGFDELEQITALNLILGYLVIFGRPQLEFIFNTNSNLNQFVFSLLNLITFEVYDLTAAGDYVIQDFDELSIDNRTPWMNFVYFRSSKVLEKITTIFHTLGQSQHFLAVHVTLQEYYYEHPTRRKEIALMWNEILASNYDKSKKAYIDEVIKKYVESDSYKSLTFTVEAHNNETLKSTQLNVIEYCVRIEGIGKFAEAMGKDFADYLVMVLYPILEKTGSGNSLLCLAGLQSIRRIATAMGHNTVSELINANSDYFTYYLVRKLKRHHESESALNALGIVLHYSSADILISLGDIIHQDLIESCDSYRSTASALAYLRLFEAIVKCMHRWYNIKIERAPVQNRRQRLEAEEEDYKERMEKEVRDFSDQGVMGMSAEQMIRSDMDKLPHELENEYDPPEVDELNKSTPPKHIQFTVLILNRARNFLGSKDVRKQLASLRILIHGVEILKEWEDELLPIVHQIWGALVPRFDPSTNPVVINFSMQLLTVMARLSKDFIRSRVAKEVLPNISTIMETLSKDSYLKDKGAAYRLSQKFKLQVIVLENVANLIVDLDIAEIYMGVATQWIRHYMSNKQPMPLQKLAVNAFKILKIYEPDLIKVELDKIPSNADNLSNLKDVYERQA